MTWVEQTTSPLPASFHHVHARSGQPRPALEALPTKITSRKRQPKQASLSDLKAQAAAVASTLTSRPIKSVLKEAGLNADLRTRHGWELALEYFTAYRNATKSFRAFDRFTRYGEANLIARLNNIETSILDQLAA